MKKINVTLILILLSILSHAQNPLVKQWDKRYGGTYNDGILSLQKTNDNGFILGGTSSSGVSGDKTQPNWDSTNFSFDYWIVKTDSLGSKLWDKDFGGTGNEAFWCIKQTTDGGYILGGYSKSGISGDKTQPSWGGWDYWIVKTDSIGNKIWDKRFGGNNDDLFYSLQQTTDGGYILGGYSFSDSSGDKSQNNWNIYSDYWIVKTDSAGNKLWDKRFGGIEADALYSVQQTNDGGYILAGWSLSGIGGDKTQPSWGNVDYWIVKTDSMGNKLWDKRFGGSQGDALYSIQQTTDNGYILGGWSYSGLSGDKSQTGWGPADYWIVKTDSLGIKQWDKDFGGSGNETSLGNITQTTDGGFLIAGASNSPISGNKTEANLGINQAWVLKTDSLGNIQWDKTLHTADTTGQDEYGLAIQTGEGCYLMANRTNAGIGGDKSQPGWGGNDYWIIKFCDTTSITSITQYSNNSISFSIYPNPAERILIIALNKNKKITVINLLGEIMIEKNISLVSKGKVDLDISFLSAGIYFIKVDNEVMKFVKE